jgi:NtrC-family two-component system response regulator AlgB
MRRGNLTETVEGVPPLSVLVVDDEANIRKTLAICLEADGHRVIAVSNFQDAVSENGSRSFDMAFVDLRLGAADGLDLIPALLAVSPWLKIVVITAYASIDSAVEAIRRGATDYLPKPFTPAQIRIAVRKVAEVRALENKIASLSEDLRRAAPDADFESASPAMRRAIETARQVAGTDVAILLRGESGTGKTVLARAIHGWSRRAKKPLGIVSCPTLSPELLESELFGHIRGAFTGALRDAPGRFAACEGGTLFLDEIGDLPLSLQPKLLRVLQDGEYERVGDPVTRRADVRIVAATHIDLDAAVREGRFREDLLYRLDVIRIDLPPLRERPEDIPAIADRLLAYYGRLHHRRFLGFTDEAAGRLSIHSWPGNLRELRNVIERASILCTADRVGVEALPDRLEGGEPPPRVGGRFSLEQVEEEHIRRILATAKSLQEAAEMLGIDQATLWRRRKQYGI